jgi:hypothetical protein
VDDKEDYTQAVEQDGAVQQHAQHLAEPVHAEFFKATIQIISYTLTFRSWVASLREGQIPSAPLLDQCRGNRATYADDHTAEPEDIDRDNKKCSMEWLSTCRHDAVNACLVGVDFLSD